MNHAPGAGSIARPIQLAFQGATTVPRKLPQTPIKYFFQTKRKRKSRMTDQQILTVGNEDIIILEQ